jgi:L-serine deaminase
VTHLPGGLNVKRRAPALYKRLMRGLYPQFPETGASLSAIPGRRNAQGGLVPVRGGIKLRGKLEHPLPPIPPRKTSFPAMETLSAYAMAVNEVNASGGRVV